MTPRWTVLGLIQEAAQYLSQKGIQTPRLDGEVLLAHALGCQRIDLYLRHDQPLTPDEVDRFRAMIRRRSRREPVAYITGVKEFWSLPFKVTPSVLIPRPETELLVEIALELLRPHLKSKQEPVKVLEIGAGCGAVAIALAKEGGEEIRLVATDRCAEALSVARENARVLGVEGRIHFLQGNVFEPLGDGTHPFALILSNPPYVLTDDISRLPPEIRDYEPLLALNGGKDGLALIRAILDQGARWLADDGSLLLETGEGQRPALEQWLEASPQWGAWRWHADLQGIDRVLSVRRA